MLFYLQKFHFTKKIGKYLMPLIHSNKIFYLYICSQELVFQPKYFQTLEEKEQHLLILKISCVENLHQGTSFI